MASLSQTILANLQNEREMAISKGNSMRLAYLNAEIEKLKKQIEVADLHERDIALRREMGISE